MKKLIAVICFMLAASPLALGQDKGKTDAKKAPPAVEKSAKAKKEPTEKQKAQQEKMKSCSKDAKDKKLKGDERKTFMKECMSAQPQAGSGKAPAKK